MFFCARCGKQLGAVGDTHQCLESFGQTGNPYSKENLVSSNLIRGLVITFAVAAVVIIISVATFLNATNSAGNQTGYVDDEISADSNSDGGNGVDFGSDSGADTTTDSSSNDSTDNSSDTSTDDTTDTSSDNSQDVPLPISLTASQLDEGYNYSIDSNLAWRWATESEKSDLECSGDATCTFVSVISLNNCADVQAIGHVSMSDSADDPSISDAAGWVGGGQSSSQLSVGESGWLELDAAENISDPGASYFFVDDLTCTIN